MNRVTKINGWIFVLLSLITIFVNATKYKGSETLGIIFMVLVFNLVLGFLVVVFANQLVKFSKKGFRVFVFYLIMVSFIYWYGVSSFMYWYYGSFISLNGVYYFFVTRTLSAMILFYVASGFAILILSLILFYFTRQFIFDSEFSSKKNLKFSKKFKSLLILSPFILLILVMIVIPKDQTYESSPIIDILAQYILGGVPDGTFSGNEFLVGEKILDFSLDVEKPNYIIIQMESISAEHLPVYGYLRNITPNIDKFAERAVVFNNAYSAASHSDYSQTAFLSSRHILTNPYRNFFDLNYPRVFIWDILKKEGNYSTAYVSSQDDNWANMIDYYNKDNLDLYYYSLSDGKYDYGSGNSRKDYDEKTIDKVLNLSNLSSEPFFLYVNLQATHYPYEYPENNSLFVPDEPSVATNYFSIAKGDEEASLNDYDNSIYYVDKQVGRLLDYLEEEGLFENTIIILSADHGEILERRHDYLRHGFGVYEEEVRVPLMIYFPGFGHQVIEERIRGIDMVPTVLDIGGFNLSEEFQGSVMSEGQDIFLSAQNQNFKLGLIRGDIKYMMNWISFIPEAYNLTEDPHELNNLIKNEKDEKFYYRRYGYLLNKWYKCQMKYYKKEMWKKGKTIEC
jgi:arylsulfatase A-like enzyme